MAPSRRDDGVDVESETVVVVELAVPLTVLVAEQYGFGVPLSTLLSAHHGLDGTCMLDSSSICLQLVWKDQSYTLSSFIGYLP